MSIKQKKQHPESGNILIYILGAIFLLGLLVAISKGSFSPGAGIDQETLIIRVAEVQQYGEELERAVAYVLANGHSEADIRFAHPDADSAYGDITDIPTRQVFSRDGGGARYREPPEGIQTTSTSWVFSAANELNGAGSTVGATETTSDLIAFLPNITQQACLKINELNDIENLLNSPPQDCGTTNITNFFVGDYTNINQLLDGSGCGGTEELLSKLEGCFEGGGTPPAGTYHYYRVLLAR